MRRPARDSHSGRDQGSTLVIATVAVVAVGVLGLVALELSASVTSQETQALENKQALYLAEAGLAEAFHGVQMGLTGQIATADAPATLGGGLLWVETIEDGDNLVELKATALRGSGRVSLGLLLERGAAESVAATGMFVAEDLELTAGGMIDGWDSAAGSYEDQVVDPDASEPHTTGGGLLQSNGSVVLGANSKPVEAYGDVRAGPSQSLTLEGDSFVTGDTTGLELPILLPEVTAPSFVTLPAIDHRGASPLVLPPGEGGFEGLTVGPNSEVVVQGPATIVFDDVLLKGDAKLTFDTSLGDIDVYVRKSLKLQVSSEVVTTSDDPAKLTIQCEMDDLKTKKDERSASVELSARASFYGFLYAPRASVNMKRDFEFFGGFSVGALSSASELRLHTDAQFRAGGEGDTPLPKLHAWRVVDMPQSVSLARIDPFRLKNTDETSAPSPAAAHTDAWLQVKYTDSSGFEQDYEGNFSAFDFSQVASYKSIKTYDQMAGTKLYQSKGFKKTK